MAEPTLQQIFGNAANQTASQLIIVKADLAAIGLTASTTNSAESLLAAIIAYAQQYLSDDNQATNTDQSIAIDDGLDSLTTRNSVTYRRKSKSITFDKADNSSTFNPNDY